MTEKECMISPELLFILRFNQIKIYWEDGITKLLHPFLIIFIFRNQSYCDNVDGNLEIAENCSRWLEGFFMVIYGKPSRKKEKSSILDHPLEKFQTLLLFFLKASQKLKTS